MSWSDAILTRSHLHADPGNQHGTWAWLKKLHVGLPEPMLGRQAFKVDAHTCITTGWIFGRVPVALHLADLNQPVHRSAISLVEDVESIHIGEDRNHYLWFLNFGLKLECRNRLSLQSWNHLKHVVFICIYHLAYMDPMGMYLPPIHSTTFFFFYRELRAIRLRLSDNQGGDMWFNCARGMRTES